MTSERLEGHLGTTVEVDVCLACQALWFDERESLQLTPRSTLRLFRLIGEQPPARRVPLVGARCPRCELQLMRAHDLQRNTRFEYLRCPKRHGRFITFFDFLREKNFIRPLSREQLEELRKNVQSVNCSNCGGAVDVAHHSTCSHCGSPLSVLDLSHASQLVAELQQADRERSINPLLGLELDRARLEVESAFAAFEQESRWFETASSAGLVGAGVSAVARWLKQRV